MPVSERFQGANVVEAGELSPYWGEHAARYVFALDYVKDRSVLDIACGTGYGMAFLKRDAESVTGVDVDIEAAREALSECDTDKTRVLLGDGTNLPFNDASFDVITSFETLEHLHARGNFLAELRRVLKPRGTLILSTPNANYTKPVSGRPSNPFHVFEYEPGELRTELGGYFSIERFLGQTLGEGTGIPPFQDAQNRLPKDLTTQIRLISWKLFNKIPFSVRESLSRLIWGTPFYPTASNYSFEADTVETAPVLVAVCTTD
jgi:SAM-dependent methyltransferase